MERNFNEFASVVRDLMKKAAESIISKLVKEIPENNLGYSNVNFGVIYNDICRQLCEKYGKILEKHEFDEFMNEYLCQDKRVFLRNPVEIPCREKEVAEYHIAVYFNNLGEVSNEYADEYLAKFVKNYMVFPLKAFDEDRYSYIYSYDGEIWNKDLYALQHFANYGEKELDEMIKKMQAIAKGYGCIIELVSEDKIYPETRCEDRMHILIKREAE